MNLEAERKLKFDRRLHTRQGWVSQQDLQAELDSLPDVSSKIDSSDAEGATEAVPDSANFGGSEEAREQPGPLLGSTPAQAQERS